MKPLPAPTIPGKTEFQKFDNAVRQVLTVSKEELLQREQAEQETKEKRRPKEVTGRRSCHGRIPA